MADVRLMKERSLATIDAANTILQNYPNFKSTNTDRSLTLFGASTDPLSFIIDIIKHTEGYDALLNIIGKFLVLGVEPMEAAIKITMLTHLQNYLSCSINPYITDEILKEGIAFNLSGMDLTNMLELCPLDPREGKHYYFGVEDIDIADYLNKSRDFNAVLWYMRNRCVGRQVWYGSKKQKDNANKVAPNNDDKHTKDDGVITLEYGEFFQTMTDSQGDKCYSQVPTRDCIHIFLGNAAPCGMEPIAGVLSDTDEQIKSKQDEWDSAQARIDALQSDLNALDENVGDIGEEEYYDRYDKISEELSGAISQADTIEEELDSLQEQRSVIETTYISDLQEAEYPEIENNYYYGKSLMKFNTDFIMSMDIFDSKVLVAQILENLTGNISISLDLNYSRRVIQEEVLKMVNSVIESDDTVVSDCFFSFSNDDYDAMLRKTDLERAGVYSNGGTPMANTKINGEVLLAMLNDVNPDSSKEEQISVYMRFFNNVSETISTTEGGVSNKFSLSLKLNILEELLTQLATAICLSVVSPKLYIITAINLKIMGRSVNFSLKDFIQMYRQMIVDLIRTVRDEMLKFFIKYIREILLDLAQRVSIDLTREQVEFYIDLLQQCIACFRLFKFGRQVNDWELGVVTADIVNEESDSPKNAEC